MSSAHWRLAAIEGRYDTVQPTPLALFGIPDDDTATMRYAIDVPDLGSLPEQLQNRDHDEQHNECNGCSAAKSAKPLGYH